MRTQGLPSPLCLVPSQLPSGLPENKEQSSGRGNPAGMTLDNRPGYWQARSLALYQSLAALPSTVTGLVPPPRTETSIPVGSWHRHTVRISACYFQHSGLPSSLAAGHAAHLVPATGGQSGMATPPQCPLLQWTPRAASQTFPLEGYGPPHIDVWTCCC